MEISFFSIPGCSEVISMKFYTWHDSCAVVACADFYSDMTPYNGVTLKLFCHRIWITMEKFFMKWALDFEFTIDNPHFVPLICLKGHVLSSDESNSTPFIDMLL